MWLNWPLPHAIPCHVSWVSCGPYSTMRVSFSIFPRRKPITQYEMCECLIMWLSTLECQLWYILCVAQYYQDLFPNLPTTRATYHYVGKIFKGEPANVLKLFCLILFSSSVNHQSKTPPNISWNASMTQATYLKKLKRGFLKLYTKFGVFQDLFNYWIVSWNMPHYTLCFSKLLPWNKLPTTNLAIISRELWIFLILSDLRFFFIYLFIYLLWGSPSFPVNEARMWCLNIIIIISAIHATAGKWPPQLAPCTSILTHSHPLTATNFLDVVSPSPFGSPSYSLSFSGCPFWSYHGPPGVAHSGYMSCPLSSHAPHSLYYIFHPCFRSYYLISNLVSLRDV